MSKLYQKNELTFALTWIAVYVVGTSMADNLSKTVGVEKIFTLPFLLLLSTIALRWMKKEGLYQKYGLCKTEIKASKFLYYLPLAVFASCNFWHGVTLNLPAAETALYIGSMICVGFLEELIFRGFLFRAMSRDNVRAAILVSSVTFGIGHIVNLFNGSGMELVSNLCQVCYAIAFGFLTVILFHRGGSLLPCIIAHSVINASSVFADRSSVTVQSEIITAMILTLIPLIYAMVLLKTLPNDKTQEVWS